MKIEDHTLEIILNKILKNNAIPILVGGCVRDYHLGIDVKDYDIEVYGLNTLEDLENILKEFGSVNLVGKNFGIVKLSTTQMEYDFSFPRIENKTSHGHTGFDVIIDGSMGYKKASKRRDFTINSIGYDYKNKTFLDPFDGIEDIQKKILRHIDETTFIEDPLRVYRAIQFSARFGFDLDDLTFKLCKIIVEMEEFKFLSKERIYEEYKKLFLKSKIPSVGLLLLKKFSLINIEQNQMKFIDEIANENINSKYKLILIFSILDKLFLQISNDKKLHKKVEELKSFQIPFIFAKKFYGIESYTKQLVLKNDMLNNMPTAHYMGKDLIEMGYKPSEKFKRILDTLYKMQLNGAIC